MNKTPVSSPQNGLFEFQNWPVYKHSLDFVETAYGICEELPKTSATGLRDQLRRAAQSIPLNISEGSSRQTGKDKANFFRIARGSAFECVAVLDIVRRLGYLKSDFESAYGNLATIGRMLSGLIKNVEGDVYGSREKT